jgi:UV DNA damage repair endonuclease
MTLSPIKRTGFACKWIDRPDQVNGIKSTDDAKQYNTGTTTVAWLSRQSRSVAEERLWNLMVQNISAVRALVTRVSGLPPSLRMVRLSSDILPVPTHPDWKYFWNRPDVVEFLERNLMAIGDIARAQDVRLSFHPGQFVVLASDNPEIVNKSIEEFEYHATLAKMMGYGKQFQDFKCNVHIAGRLGPDGIRAAYQRLSTEARNTITIENEENAWGLLDCLTIADFVPIVLDIHHHWCREGEYIQPNDQRVLRVIDSWRGQRPTIHYSVSREDWLPGHCPDTLPDYRSLLESGHKKQKLRSHSDFMWNKAANRWALSFNDTMDIMVECKSKNLGAHRLLTN